MATVILKPTPSTTGHDLWILEVSDNVVPGFDSLLTYSESTYATLTLLQHAITSMSNNIQTEIDKLEIPTNQGSSAGK